MPIAMKKVGTFEDRRAQLAKWANKRLVWGMVKKTKSTPKRNPAPPPFLKELLEARSPSGYEDDAREVVRKRVESHADSFSIDALGSCHAALGAKGSPTLMLPDTSTNWA